MLEFLLFVNIRILYYERMRLKARIFGISRVVAICMPCIMADNLLSKGLALMTGLNALPVQINRCGLLTSCISIWTLNSEPLVLEHPVTIILSTPRDFEADEPMPRNYRTLTSMLRVN